jgi:membrane protein insertase Oxa1/YidC/SpoIIIJ
MQGTQKYFLNAILIFFSFFKYIFNILILLYYFLSGLDLTHLSGRAGPG